jgi:hypothetical protein
MKLSNAVTKLTCVKSTAVRVLAAATLAGAALIAATPAAEAQHFAIGVHIGGPRYVAPAPVYYGREPVYVAPRRFDDHAEWVRQQELARHDRFDRDRDNDRNRNSRFEDHDHDGRRR